VNGSRYRPVELVSAAALVLVGLVALAVLMAARPCLDCPILRPATSTAIAAHEVTP
jgi:hypothetical protein